MTTSADDGTWAGKLNNIFYIHIVINRDQHQSERAKTQLESAIEDMTLSNSLTSIKSNDMVRKNLKNGGLKKEEWIKTTSYSAKIASFVTLDFPWLELQGYRTYGTEYLTNDIPKLHQDIISRFTDGYGLTGPAKPELRLVLTAAKEAVTIAEANGDAEDFFFLILIAYYTWEETLQDWRTSISLIRFPAGKSLAAYFKSIREDPKSPIRLFEIEDYRSPGVFSHDKFTPEIKQDIQRQIAGRPMEGYPKQCTLYYD